MMLSDLPLPGSVLTNSQLRATFKCSSQGGMRRSRRTNTLIIISDHTKGIYDDNWIDNILNYTGMGLRGDQNLKFAQNKTLAQSNSNGVNVHIFEVFEKSKYVYMGQAELADEPYQERQQDIDGNERSVWMFPLRLIDSPPPVPSHIIKKKDNKRAKEAKKISDAELLKRIRSSSKKAGVRTISSQSYERNPYVAELAKRRANGKCQLCNKPAPFNTKSGEPFLEVHHIKWLSDGGEDTLENTVALCPNCHRRMHILNDSKSVKHLLKLKYQ